MNEVCLKCGGDWYHSSLPLRLSNGDEVQFKVCGQCWEVSDYVNGERRTVVFVPVKEEPIDPA